MFDLIVKNGLVITPDAKEYKDIAVSNGKIVEIEKKGSLSCYEANDCYDAEGKCVIPGLVEPHMHIKAPLGGVVDILDFDTADNGPFTVQNELCGALTGVEPVFVSIYDDMQLQTYGTNVNVELSFTKIRQISTKRNESAFF